MYCFASVASTVTAALKNHLGLFNGNGSGLVLEVWRIEVNPHQTGAVVGIAVPFVVARTTAGGTVTTPAVLRKFDLGEDPLPAQITAGLAYSAQPTVTANSELAQLPVNPEETVGHGNKSPLFQAEPEKGLPPITVAQGAGVVIQQGAVASAVGAVSVFVYFKVRRA